MRRATFMPSVKVNAGSAWVYPAMPARSPKFKSVATSIINNAKIEITAPITAGNSNRQTNTPTVITTEPNSPITATRKLVSCRRATARLTVFGMAAVNASEMMNQNNMASTR